MSTNGTTDAFITIVPVGEARPSNDESNFVTVLSVEAIDGASEIHIHRPKGERLGLGLKFEGGSAANETVRRLLVQSCTEGSPAAQAITPWGLLIPGDEILAIDGVPVPELTRIDCVKRLKDSDEILKLMVKHIEPKKDEKQKEKCNGTEPKQVLKLERPTMPPPVPPRKLGKRNSFKTEINTSVVCNTSDLDANKLIPPQMKNVKLFRKSSFDSHLHRQAKEVMKRSPEEVRRLVRRLSDGKTIPPQAEVYVDLLSQEWERCLALADAESDDTGSSICTVVDRLSSKASSVANSIPSTPIAQHKMIDINRVLSCIENIDSDLLSDALLESNNPDKRVKDCAKSQNESAVKLHQEVKREFSKEMSKGAMSILVDNDFNSLKKSDKNNNLLNKNITCINIEVPPMNIKNEISVPRPKPMPRHIKPEALKINIEKDVKKFVPPVEELLTPNKKNCIETWLQRSEQELTEELVHDPVEDILPRLIDFVPKPNFIVSDLKVCDVNVVKSVNTVSVVNSEPIEKFSVTDIPREDGSGASLDTIGEDDETVEVINSVDSPDSKIQDTKTKIKYKDDTYLWNGIGNKSDSEEKSLSNDETPPTCPRQPPDGVEAPTDAIEKHHDSRFNSLKTESRPPRASLPAKWSTSPRTKAFYSRKQDERSECSVRDKIAMFSNAASTDQVDKCGISAPFYNSQVNLTKSNENKLGRKLARSYDNLLMDSPNNSSSFRKPESRPEVLGGVNKTYNISRRETIAEISPAKVFYPDTSISKKSFTKDRLRSSSVDESSKSHRATLEMLIEQRKKSMSKLRGLVLPENQGPISDLPEIKIKAPSFIFQSPKNPTPKMSRKQLNLKDTLKNNLLPNNIPKYSPAFKRKSLQLYSVTHSKEHFSDGYLSSLERVPRLSLDAGKPTNMNTGYFIKKEYDAAIVGDRRTLEKLCSSNIYGSMEVKLCTATDVVDSDNDSAVSSTQSSYRSSASSPLHTIDSIESDSSHLSPRSSQYVPFSLVKNGSVISNISSKICANTGKPKVSRSMSSDLSVSSSSGSGATSGSQASCSSLESNVVETSRKKVSRTHSIDSLNRRNILASAKCRSGRDLKVNSPVLETKFNQEQLEQSPSPQLRVNDHQSSLTINSCALQNKVDSRRTRSKILTETDSDSEIDAELRSRKVDSKPSRNRKNPPKSEITSYPQNIETQTNSELPYSKANDTPKVISERILKEIKQAGLGEKSLMSPMKPPTETSVPNRNEKVNVSRGFENKFNLGEVNKVGAALPPPLNEGTKTVDEVYGKSFQQNAPTTTTVGSTMKVCLKKGSSAGVGIILAGGRDCEAKTVTIHKVLAGSIAEKEGLKKGFKVVSINGKALKGLTHAETVSLLKEPRPEVSIEIESRSPDCGSETSDSKECSLDSIGSYTDVNEGSIVKVVLTKNGGGAGLGFGLDGGKDSPLGDKPLTIKKLFAGGAAARSGLVHVGAELLSAGDITMTGLTRTEAWARLKDLPEGSVTLVLRNA